MFLSMCYCKLQSINIYAYESKGVLNIKLIQFSPTKEFPKMESRHRLMFVFYLATIDAS